jgi:hypothetical protein
MTRTMSLIYKFVTSTYGSRDDEFEKSNENMDESTRQLLSGIENEDIMIFKSCHGPSSSFYKLRILILGFLALYLATVVAGIWMFRNHVVCGASLQPYQSLFPAS